MNTIVVECIELQLFSHIDAIWDMDRYGSFTFIAANRCSEIFKAIDNTTQEVVALKFIPKGYAEAKAEPEFLTGLQHPNIVQLLTFYEEEDRVALVLEYGGLDLSDFIRRLPTWPLPYKIPGHLDKIKDILYQLLEGLAFLHQQDILHLDLKPENILMDATGRIRICDFGIAERSKSNEPLMTLNTRVSRYYRPPELFLHKRPLSKAVDIWSVGAIFGKLLNRRTLFSCMNDKAPLESMVR